MNRFKRRLICRLVPITAASRIKWSESPMRPSTLFAVQRGAAMMYNKKNPVCLVFFSLPLSLFLVLITLLMQLRPLGRLVDREEKKRMKLKKLGINYEFDGYVITLPFPPLPDPFPSPSLYPALSLSLFYILLPPVSSPLLFHRIPSPPPCLIIPCRQH